LTWYVDMVAFFCMCLCVCVFVTDRNPRVLQCSEVWMEVNWLGSHQWQGIW